MMSLEGPFLAAVIARMADPKFNLAAYGVAYSLALVFEAPVIMMMSAATAMVKDRISFIKLRNFTYALCAAVTFFMILMLIPSVFDFLMQSLIGLPENISELTYKAFIILLPWPAAIGYRRFFQGILITRNLTKRVAYGTLVRLITMAAVALFLYFILNVDGVIVGAAALSCGVIAEAFASRLMTGKSAVYFKTMQTQAYNEGDISYRSILKFYYPLAATSLISLGVHPMVTFFIGQSRMAIESLAVLPVINSLVFIFRSLGLSYQEVVIAMMGENNENFKSLKKFALILGSLIIISLGTISLSPLSDFWFGAVSGLSSDLVSFSKLPLIIVSILPVLTVLISFQRGLLVNARNTGPVSTASAVEVAGIIFIVLIMTYFFDSVGVVAAVSGYIIGRIAANIYLHYSIRRI